MPQLQRGLKEAKPVLKKTADDLTPVLKSAGETASTQLTPILQRGAETAGGALQEGPPRRHAAMPLRRHTVTPSHRRTVAPSHHHAVTPSHLCTATPPHRHTVTLPLQEALRTGVLVPLETSVGPYADDIAVVAALLALPVLLFKVVEAFQVRQSPSILLE